MLGLIMGLWQLLFSAVFTETQVVATPSEIVSNIVEERSFFWGQLVVTAKEAAIGLGLGVAFGVLLALISLTSRAVEANVFALAVVLNSIPLIVFAPLLVIWFGAGMTPRITVAALAVFFVVLVNVARGLKDVSTERRELFTSFGAGKLDVFWHLRVPSSLPYLLSALRIAVVASLLGAVIGEWVGANEGLGVVLIFSLYQFQTDRLWSAMVLITAVALLAYVVVSLCERFVVPWHESVRKPRLEIER